MIVREMPNGQLLCINQTSHALMAAEFCRHWGRNSNTSFSNAGFNNGDFAVPSPYAEVMVGISQHDNGWFEWEQHPKLRPDGYPMDFLHDPDVSGKLALWQLGIQRAYAQHPYGALLIGRYASMLYQEAPEELFTPEEHGHIDGFIAEQQRLVHSVREALSADPRMHRGLGKAQFESNACLLRFGDRSSLQVTMPWATSVTLDKCPVDGNGTYTEIEMSFDEGEITFSPWPFGVSTFQVHCHGRLLNQRHFTSDSAYHNELAEAPIVSFVWQVVPG